MPLGEILAELLDMGQRGMGRPVEMEFAVAEDPRGLLEFHMLQIRPMVAMKERSQVAIECPADSPDAVVATDRALGNGVIADISDVIFVPPATFDKMKTVEMAEQVGKLNAALAGRPYLLVGPGRWGTRDRFLGIPVEWDQISGAKVIVEAGLEDFRIDPSHGSHFFHNITSLQVGYFTLDLTRGEDTLDLDWLESMESTGDMVRHLSLPTPLVLRIDGRVGKGLGVRRLA